MRCDEAQELITASVDNELAPAERTAIESHLADCHDCRMQLEREKALKGDLRRARGTIIAPPILRAKIAGQIETASAAEQVERKRFSDGRLGWPVSRPVWAIAAALVLAIAVIYQLRPVQNIAALALATHKGLVSGKEQLARVSDPVELKKQLSLAVNYRFAPLALDLSPVKVYPVAGLVKKIGTREVLVTVYEGDGPTITCYTFLGTEADAPKDAEVFRDGEMHVNFYIFSKNPLNAVLHKEGDVICILVAKMPPAEILNLLRGKTHHA